MLYSVRVTTFLSRIPDLCDGKFFKLIWEGFRLEILFSLHQESRVLKYLHFWFGSAFRNFGNQHNQHFECFSDIFYRITNLDLTISKFQLVLLAR